MLKEMICTAFFLALILASALQKLSWEVAGKEVSSMKPTSIKPPIDSEKLSPLSQASVLFAPTPFGRYTENINGVLLELARVPQGTFLMGNDRSPNPEEKPAHQASVRSFFIGQYEISRQQWNMVATTLPSITRPLRQQYIGPLRGTYYGENTPAEELSWEEAVEFCDRLAKYTGKKYRLPSEAEWEYACRAGTKTEYSFGDQFDPSLANLVFVSDHLLPVGQLGYANTWGLYDMHGNAAEWCLDNEHSNYVGAPSDGTAWTQGSSDNSKVLRGGRYRFRAEIGRSSARTFYLKNLIITGFGLRVVTEVTPSAGNGIVTPTSAASYANINLAIESIAALFGSNLSGEMQIASSTPLPTTLAGASVYLKDSKGDEYLAPLFFVSPNQINFQVPSGLKFGAATIVAVNKGVAIASGTIEIASISPGLFSADASGRGLAAALALRVKSNGEQVYEPATRFDQASGRIVAVPIDLGNPSDQVFLLLYGTGMRNHSSLTNVAAKIGGVGAEAVFVGAQGSLVGLDQCNLRLPNTLAGRGEVNVTLTIDDKTTNMVKINIK